ncbi:MAG TPA: hypothetical protein VJH68_01705 [Candidatus Nanoarchaeia archaeon]|nr:hypothetical protein [Candidatus Nanoarchaeia archaeon]
MPTNCNKSVYLYDDSILSWNDPNLRQKKFCRFSGSTTIIDFLGLDSINLRVGDYSNQTGSAYHIHASAAKYLADIIHADNSGTAQEAKRKILFAGAIAIYQLREIPGSKIRGPDLVANGRIWASTADHQVSRNPSGLRNLVLGDFDHPAEAVARVKLVVEELGRQALNYPY